MKKYLLLIISFVSIFFAPLVNSIETDQTASEKSGRKRADRKISRYKKEKKGEYVFYGDFIHILPLGYSEKEIITILSKHPKPSTIRDVSIGAGYGLLGPQVLTEKLLQYVSGHFPYLEELGIIGCKIDQKNLENSAIAFPYLKIFSIGMLPSEQLDREAEILAKAMPRLEELTIDGSLSDSVIESYCLFCPHLRGLYTQRYYIDLSPNRSAFCQNTLTERSIKAMTDYGNNLSRVAFVNTSFGWEAIKGFLINHEGVEMWLVDHLVPIPLDEAIKLHAQHPFTLNLSYPDGRKGIVPSPYNRDDD